MKCFEEIARVSLAPYPLANFVAKNWKNSKNLCRSHLGESGTTSLLALMGQKKSPSAFT